MAGSRIEKNPSVYAPLIRTSDPYFLARSNMANRISSMRGSKPPNIFLECRNIYTIRVFFSFSFFFFFFSHATSVTCCSVRYFVFSILLWCCASLWFLFTLSLMTIKFLFSGRSLSNARRPLSSPTSTKEDEIIPL